MYAKLVTAVCTVADLNKVKNQGSRLLATFDFGDESRRVAALYGSRPGSPSSALLQREPGLAFHLFSN